ncbi:molybdenum cofactor guanylyltransferase [Cyanobacteria bacterium FACHB-472]|nr:molybdenum cofactor guanylyltransferase [Cyanobacteria bacterium FACHB-472]
MNISQAESVTAIVLAGGQSSRMGRDKALISVNNVPLIRQVCEVAQECASVVYVVTPWIERYQDILPSNCQLIREVYDLEAGKTHGPLIGFRQALELVQTDWVLLLACDLPNLKVEVLQSWLQQLSEVPEDAIALLPRHPKGWEPLCGFYRRCCLPLLSEYINRGGRSFQHWLAEHSVQELPVTQPEVLFNCNTPADLEALEN